eukprot:CAMPEP_0201721536 /NCGR_PEP_ID=MMETSP0593-20130828/6187_1 /ASSEMBLY_ACC=CAM_ASM_000672 /TAXON_ID=267983 /ORGANISM="Skeletonema japonicum, Strain CCMP2506" /LENGTH=321 /DNA_ID=CAMNT_0048212365 /DNA_START=86 /DNA_END=1048 /DNA_ORIENTATION=+
MSAIKAVRQLKEDLLKQQAALPGDGRNEKILDILQRLEKQKIDLGVLTETLIGASVSKLKKHENADIANTAKGLVKKWKGVANQAKAAAAGGGNKTSKSDSNISTSSGGSAKSASSSAKQKRTSSAGSSELSADAEFLGLPPHRINICKKFHTIFLMSKSELSKELNESAVSQLCITRAAEADAAIDTWSKGMKPTYMEKVRSLVFNLKKNGPLREQVILGQVSADRLTKMSSEELLSEEKAKERDATVKSLQDSRRLDWEQANEGKINEMCGIKGDLLKASLFTCGRCKSVKTTSTQKQTRSADEPMTVFVFCLNCGNRW